MVTKRAIQLDNHVQLVFNGRLLSHRRKNNSRLIFFALLSLSPTQNGEERAARDDSFPTTPYSIYAYPFPGPSAISSQWSSSKLFRTGGNVV